MKNYVIYIGQLILLNEKWTIQANSEEEAERKFIASLSEQYKEYARTMGVKVYEENLG